MRRIRRLVFRDLRERCAAFLKEDVGAVVVLAAAALPVVALAAVGAIQIAYVVSVRAKTQSIADSAVLMAAQQLGLGGAASQSRAEAWATSQLVASLGSQTSYSVTSALLNDNTEVEVTIRTNTPSFFGPELPVGGFPTTVHSTAQAVNQTPLCVLVTAADWPLAINLEGGQISASCLVYSDSGILVAPGASITAQTTEAGWAAWGSVKPAALTGASPVSDPFADVSLTFPSSCIGPPTTQKITSNTTIAAGAVECDNIEVAPNVAVTLGPGEVYFNRNLTLDAGASVSGTDVAVFFGPGAQLSFDPTSSVTLDGRHTGQYAGFVVIASPAQTMAFKIPTDPISKVTGVIYSRAAPLIFSGSNTSAQASDWTVIVAKALQFQGSPHVVVNANYAASSVPVPSGVGPVGGSSRLVQ
jgi:Flp pilus assembly protein TadG